MNDLANDLLDYLHSSLQKKLIPAPIICPRRMRRHASLRSIFDSGVVDSARCVVLDPSSGFVHAAVVVDGGVGYKDMP